jgi:OOP family OmpA-OmpF porin
MVNGILYAKGAALNAWLEKAKNLAPMLPGVVYFHGDGLVNISQAMKPPESIRLVLEKGVLRAQGTASHEWILGARERAKTVPGIVAYRDYDVVDSDRKEMERLKAEIEKFGIFFGRGSNRIMPEQREKLEGVSEDLKRFIRLSEILGISPRIKILGHTDSTGPEKTNLGLSLQRAEKVRAALVSMGVGEHDLSTVGMASTDPLRDETSEGDRAFNRRVDFRIILPAS